MGPWIHDRIKISTLSGKTHLISAAKVPEHCRRRLVPKKAKIYASYSTLKGGMKEKDVDYNLLRVIDLDGIASDNDLETISRMFPNCPLIRSNGIQVFFLSALSWEEEAPLLALLGKEAQNRSNLTYDARVHLRKGGDTGDHESHAFRVPFGWSDKRKCDVEAYLPLQAGATCSPREAMAALGLQFPEVKREVPAAPSEQHRTPENTAVSTRRTIKLLPGKGESSLSANYSEFSEILKTRVFLMKQGLTRGQAEARILEMKWKHHTSSQLQVALQQRPAWVAKGRDGKLLTQEEFKSLIKDFSEHPQYLTTLVTQKQRYYQETWSLAAHRAWSLNIFYAMGLDGEECVEAFFSRPEFTTLHALSLEAIGRPAIEDDIRACWAKFHDYEQQQVKEASVQALKVAIESLKKAEFKATDLSVPEIKSTRQLQKALKVLWEEGFLKKIGSGRWTKYRVK